MKGILGADVIVSKITNTGQTFQCADPEFVGVMPVKQEIETLPSDEPGRPSIGWKISEIVGTGIVNPPSTPESRQLRWAEDILSYRIFKFDSGDTGWALMEPPYITSYGGPGEDCIGRQEPDYNRIAYGQPRLRGSKTTLEAVQYAAQTIVDLDKQKR